MPVLHGIRDVTYWAAAISNQRFWRLIGPRFGHAHAQGAIFVVYPGIRINHKLETKLVEGENWATV